MIQLIGMMLTLSSGILLGFYKAAQFANRPRQLRQLHHALQRFETEIVYGQTLLTDAMLVIGLQITEPIGSMFVRIAKLLNANNGMSLAEIWSTEIESTWKYTSMKNNEKQAMLSLGQSIGTSDKQDQMKHLHLAMRQLQMEEEIAKEEQKKYETMWKSLGFLAGALIVILMY